MLVFSAVGCFACEGTEPEPIADGIPATIAITAGNDQTFRTNASLPVQPAVKVADAAGHPIPNVVVTFSVASGGGSVLDTVVTTDASGVAVLGAWTLGPTLGAQTLTAAIATPGVTPATIRATGRLPHWTVLVYMAADNDLALEGIADLEEMEAAGVNPEVQVVVQAEFSPQHLALHGCGLECVGRPNFNTFRYAIASGTPRSGPDGPVIDLGDNRNMTSAAELREFVAWGQQNYPAERTLLVLWNHGGGYTGLIQDATSARGKMMTVAQLQPALSGFDLDIVGFDMCLMAGYETLESIKGLARYAVFSEDIVPGDGLPYEKFLEALHAAPETESRSVAGMITSTFHTSYQGDRSSTTISAYDLTQYVAFRSVLDDVAQTMTANLPTLGPAIASALVNGQKYTYRELTDLVTFIDSLSVRITDAPFLHQLAALRQAAIGTFRVDNLVRNGLGSSLGVQPDVLRSTGLHVVLPSGVNGDHFFAAGARSFSSYHGLYPSLPWTNFLEVWIAEQATTAYVDQGDSRLEVYVQWPSQTVKTGVDVDLWVMEPSGNLYIPYLGTVTPNGDFTPESSDVMANYEGWRTRQHLQLGVYKFYAHLWDDPAGARPTVQFLHRRDQTQPLEPLYAAGTEPRLSRDISWENDPNPTFEKIDADAYTDVRAITTIEVTESSDAAAMASLQREASRNVRPQVVAGAVGQPMRVSAGRLGVAGQPTFRAVSPDGKSSKRTVTSAITAEQFKTARRLLRTRPARRPGSSAVVRELP